MSKDYFSADWHLGHPKVIVYDASTRPFKTIEQHDEAILSLVERTVTKEDNLYFMGDFSLCKDKQRVLYYFERLKGLCNYHWFKGNHDHSDTVKMYKQYGEYHGYKDELTIHEQLISAQHFPELTWNKSHHGSWMIHGHEHGALKHVHNVLVQEAKRFDAAINLSGFDKLPEFQDIAKYMAKKPMLRIGHHISER